MKLSLGPCGAVLLTFVACSANDPSGSAFHPSASTPAPDTPSPGFDPSGDTAPPAPTGDLNACATATTAAVAKQVYLVFAYDQSGSMVSNQKWTAAGDAMKAFFTSKDSEGLHASLTFFPDYTAVTTPGDFTRMCDARQYSTPSVPVEALPSAAFGAAIDATEPRPDVNGKPSLGGTPTVAALTGAMAYAEALRAGVARDASIAVVMVTDGMPQHCADNDTVDPAANVAKEHASSIPTYIVGVGNRLELLNPLAEAGGTKHAFLVSVGDPKKTQLELNAAIRAIGASALACDYKIPAPPDGKVIDPNAVNVQFTPKGAAPSVLGYNASCKGGTGWRYDNASKPSRVIACDASCKDLKTKGSRVDLVFGCATQNASIR